MGASRVGGGPSNGQVAVTGTATLIVAGRTLRKSVLVQNLGAGLVYFGGPTVTTGNAPRLAVSESTSFDDYNGPVYGVSDATADVRYLEIF